MEELEYNNFIYRNFPLKGEYIGHNKPKPIDIYKYYGISKYSVDALIKGYLYASHPFDLNDTLDSNFSIFTASGRIEKKYYKGFYKETKKQNFDKFYDEDIFNKTFLLDLYSFISTKLGIISMNTDSNNDLIWPHYTQEKGFQLMFKTTRLEQSIRDNLKEHDDYLGFYPVNYCSVLRTIDLSKLKGYLLAFLYLTNVKTDCWSYENEWRFVIGKNNMNIPYTKLGLHPGIDKGEIENRYVYYDRSLVERIVIGKNFFNGRSFIVKLNGKQKVWKLQIKQSNSHFDTNFYKEFLEYIIDNLADKFYISETIGVPDNSSFRIERRIRKANLTKGSAINEYILSITDEENIF